MTEANTGPSPELAVFLNGLPLWVKVGWALAMLLATVAVFLLKHYGE